MTVHCWLYKCTETTARAAFSFNTRSRSLGVLAEEHQTRSLGPASEQLQESSRQDNTKDYTCLAARFAWAALILCLTKYWEKLEEDSAEEYYCCTVSPTLSPTQQHIPSCRLAGVNQKTTGVPVHMNLKMTSWSKSPCNFSHDKTE